LGSSSQGSFALSKDKTETFALIVTGTLQEIQEVMENDFLDPLWELNGWDEELRPKFVVEQIQFRDIEQITNALNQLAKAGAPILPDDPAINEIRDQMGISHQPEREIDLLAPNPLNPLAAAVPGAPPLPEEPTPKEEPEDKDEV
jgi:phage gp29-like protein